MSDPQVTEHQITLRFHRTGNESVRLADEETVLNAITKIEGWSYIDEYEIECERFTVYQPEFDEPTEKDGIPASATIWTITFGSSSAFPAFSNDEWPVGAIDIIVGIQKCVAAVFPHFKYLRCTQYLKYEYSVSQDLPY